MVRIKNKDEKGSKIKDNSIKIGFGLCMRCFLYPCISLLFFIIVTDTSADVIDNLNVGLVQINGQTQRAQSTAARKAFEQVLVKNSGSPSILSNDIIKQAVQNYERYLVSNRFVSLGNKQFFQASFSQSQIISIIRQSGEPIWGNRRPNAIVWLATQSNVRNDRQWININNGSLLSNQLIEDVRVVSEQKGIIVNWPIGDLLDSNSVSMYDIWGLFTSRLLSASERYNPEYVIIARIQQDNSEQTGDVSHTNKKKLEWIIANQGNISSGELLGESESELLNSLMTVYAENIAAVYSISVQASGSVNIIDVMIKNVESLERYMALNEFFTSISVISAVELYKQHGQSAHFKLRTSTDRSNLIDILKLDGRLKKVENDDVNNPMNESNKQKIDAFVDTSVDNTETDTPLIYEWVY